MHYKIKIICYPCKAEFIAEKEQFICVNKSFDCEYSALHDMCVSTGSSHPFLCALQNLNKICFCSECLPYKICSVCNEKTFNLNYKCKKFCLSCLPESVKKFGFKLNYFLDQEINSELFFFFETNLVCATLDNP